MQVSAVQNTSQIKDKPIRDQTYQELRKQKYAAISDFKLLKDFVCINERNKSEQDYEQTDASVQKVFLILDVDFFKKFIEALQNITFFT